MPEKPDDLQKKVESAVEKKAENPDIPQAHTPAHEPELEPAKVQERAMNNEAAIQTTLDKLGARSKVAEAPKEQPFDLKMSEVTTREDFRKAMDVMHACFTDPTDLETNITFARFYFQPELARYEIVKDGDKPIGVELIRLNPNIPTAMYVPYAGIYKGPDADYRNMGIYPKMAEISDKQMRERGKDHVLYEFEDHRAITGNVYPDEKPEDVQRRIEGRQNFWKRSVDCHIVNDQDVPYCRPASDDPQKTQAYDSLAFRTLDKNDPKWNSTFNEDKTAISRESYENFYLEIMQLEYGNKDAVPTKDELRKNYPAIDQFFKQMEAHPDKQWISIDATAPRQKATPDTNEPMRAIDPGIDERASRAEIERRRRAA